MLEFNYLLASSWKVNSLKTNKFWIIILSGLIILSAAIALLLMQQPTADARIYLDGTLVDIIDLTGVTEQRELHLSSGSNFNTILLQPGRVRVYDANCPDGACIRQGWLSDGVIPIVCLPHRLVIRLSSTIMDGLGLDAIVG